MIDSITALAFSLFENKGVYALLLGSGMSRAAQIPTGWEITLDLIRRAAALQGVFGEADWAAWHRSKTGEEPTYSAVLTALSSFPDERRSILHSYIEPTVDDIEERRKTPTRAHRAIAWLVREGFIRVILTTNFDHLMENALREVGVEPTVIRSDDDLQGAIPLIHSRCFLVKIHGDYLDIRIKNTEEELGTYSSALDGLLDRIFDEHGLIVCGWSGEWDHALRAAIRRAPNRRFPTFWAARGAMSPKAEDLVSHRRAKTIPILDGDSFFVELQQKVSTQLETQRPDPRSIELLIATVKRQIARPELRIQLSDLLAGENRRFHEVKDAVKATLGSVTPQEEYRKQARRYEIDAESLARIFGILGRYGGDHEQGLAAEILGDVAYLKVEAGLTWWLDLKFYPSVLLFYAYGLGLVKAGKYDMLFRWCTLRVRLENNESLPIIVRISNWWAETHDRWKMLEGLNNARTPLSDHLHKLTAPWSSDYMLAEREHTRLFETFEILHCLAFLTLSGSKTDFERAHSGNPNSRNFLWSPATRACWDNATRSLILAEFEQPDLRATILEAGFGHGDETLFALTVESLRRQMSLNAWR